MEEEPNIDGPSRKVAFEMARHDARSALLLNTERLARVGVFDGRFSHPSLDGVKTDVSAAFVLDDGFFGETPRNGFCVEPVSGEIRSNGFWKVDCHYALRRLDETQSERYLCFR